VAAALSGLLFAASFPPLHLGWLAWVSLAPLGLALEGRARSFAAPPAGRAPARGTGFALGYLAGFVLFLAGLHWIAFLSAVAVTVPGIMYPAWVAAAAYLALYPALASWVALGARRALRLPIAVGLPLAWLGAEKLRSLGELGFPWLTIGYSQWEYGPLLQWAAVGGAFLVGAWVAAGNGCALAAWLALRDGRRGRAGAWALAAVALVGVTWGVGALALTPRDPGEYAGRRVALVQGNIPGDVKWSGRHQTEVLSRFLAMSRAALAERPDFIIWPETATGSYLRRDITSLIAVQSLVDSSRVPIVAGYPDFRRRLDNGYDLFNAAGVFVPDVGIAAQYAKMHLVPFGERLPFQWLIPALGRIDLGQAEFLPGDSLVLLPVRGERGAVLVCFESIFPDGPRAARQRGATLLLNLTNDEWFGRTGALYQHAAMAVFRAVETRLPLARCANTGLTFLVDTRGRIYERGGVFTTETRIGRLDRPGPSPPYVRWGDWPGWAALALTALVALAARLAANTAAGAGHSGQRR
jgi:apolipoprotein N-acyltransferase